MKSCFVLMDQISVPGTSQRSFTGICHAVRVGTTSRSHPVACGRQLPDGLLPVTLTVSVIGSPTPLTSIPPQEIEKANNSKGISHALLVLLFVALACLLRPAPVTAQSQQSASTTTSSSRSAEQLPAVEIEPPRSDRRQTQVRTGDTAGGFGADNPIPSGQPGSDFALTPSEVISTGGRPQNLANVPSAVSIVENKGIEAQGKLGVPNMLQGLPGIWTSGSSAVPFDNTVAIRGFSLSSQNRVMLLYDGRMLNTPMQDANFTMVFPELIDRIEVLRSDGTVQFGTKAIGGTINIIPKRPRQNPGTYWGVEMGSWQTTRAWCGSNMVRGPLAAGIFAGRYETDGFRVYEGNGKDEEPLPRPGPWRLNNLQGSINWKITGKLTFEISQLWSDSRTGYGVYVLRPEWERRDTRNIAVFSGLRTPAWDGPVERGDAMSIGRLFYSGDRLGNIEIIGSYFKADLKLNCYNYSGLSDRRWYDQGLTFRYFRTDRYSVVTNDFTIGSDLWDGRFCRVGRVLVQTSGYNVPTASGEQSGYRESLSYYVMNQTRLWDRLYVDLGYRLQKYDFRDLYANNAVVVTCGRRMAQNKSASQYSFGLVYDKELGSSMYYKHSRVYRFPEFYDMVKTGTMGYVPVPPFVFLDPEEGTLEEVGIRHWFSRNIYLGVTYYELDMDSEIIYGLNDIGQSANLNVRDVSHFGVELDALIRITPFWTIKGNWTRQRVIIRSDYLNGLAAAYGRSTEDTWLTQNPGEMASLSLEYNNKDWGFSSMIKFYYMGSRFRQGDYYNVADPLEPAKWGDIALSQSLFDDAVTLVFGIRNFTDAQYALLGYASSPSASYPLGNRASDGWYPNEGRSYYAGFKTNMDFDRLRIPTMEDLNRMQKRLYGSLESTVDRVSGWGRSIRDFTSF